MRTVFRRHKLLFASLSLGLSAFALSLSTISSYVKSEPVVVAVRDLEPFQRIGPTDVAVREMPAKAVTPDCLQQVKDAVGRYARSRLVSGQVLMEGHLIADQADAGLSYDLPADRRAFFLPVPASRAMGGLVKRGERVDLIAVPRSPDGGLGVRGDAVTVAKGLPVLEVVRESSAQEFAGVAVLAFPEECEVMARYLENGNVYLSLVPRTADEPSVPAEVWPYR